MHKESWVSFPWWQDGNGGPSPTFLHFFGTFAAHFRENVNVQTQSFSQRYISPGVAGSRVSRDYKLAFIRVVSKIRDIADKGLDINSGYESFKMKAFALMSCNGLVAMVA
jgi:hypothetical protein